MNQIAPYTLWIGNAGEGRNISALYDSGISCVVQVAYEEPLVDLPRDFVVCRFPLVDGPGNDPILVRLAIDTLAAMLKSRKNTLVCCGAGMSRSPAIAAASLAVFEDRPKAECLAQILEKRKGDVSPGLWADILSLLDVPEIS